jgi:hypothetical protein
MVLLGLNSFTLAPDPSKFVAIARLFNSPAITISLDWAKALASRAAKFGYKITVHSGHGWGYHVHLNGGLGKLSNLHIRVSKSAYDFLVKLLKK